MNEIYLPMRIMRMIKALHNKGYTALYLYSGLSPSGMHWRYEIGQMENNQWPSQSVLAKGSVQDKGQVDWSNENSTVELLVNDFECYYQHQLNEKKPHNDYTQWYAQLINSLQDNELLSFYADYGGRHQDLLKTAPGFSK
ncbi:MAG: hypothetical protein AB8B80_11775 [Marinicellaceae bacterium]